MNKTKKVLLTIVVLLLFTMLGLNIYLILNKEIVQTTNITKTEKEVTITDQGIDEAVDKLYDATVIVELTSDDTVTGWGSGFVYKTDDKYAYIITNYHVTEDNKKVTIEYTNGTTTEGTVIGGDEYTDVSVVRVDKDTIIKVAEISDNSSSVKLGDTVFAIGTPVSIKFKFTVTRGILSGRDRLMQMSNQNTTSLFARTNANIESWYINLLQIDASINSGNSGGPLANANGEVIGITNSKLASSSIENIGFAVPIEDVKNVAEQVISNGEVSRPYVGVGLTSIPNAIRTGLIKETDEEGIVVGTIEDDSSAKHAGLKEGDIITKFGDYDISTVEYFKYYLNRYKPGDKITITYIRDGKSNTTELTLGKKS